MPVCDAHVRKRLIFVSFTFHNLIPFLRNKESIKIITQVKYKKSACLLYFPTLPYMVPCLIHFIHISFPLVYVSHPHWEI